MCGLAGFIGTDLQFERRESALRAMTDSLIHRGPDAVGIFLDNAAGIGLGLRRLAIVDLSENGRQPMVSESGRFVIVFNGEIYNFNRLRPELTASGHSFRGHSDTEVMLAAFEEWGVEQSLKKFNGMFAFALLDRDIGRLWLARDRLGKKPLYYSMVNGALIFGSELKSLHQYPLFSGELDRDAACLYLRHNCFPAPFTVFKNVRKLEPASFLYVDVNAGRISPIHTGQYWSAAEMHRSGQSRRFSGSFTDALDELDRILRDSIAMRLIADVPLGVFLSGGIDSSLVAALMQAQCASPIKSFTIGSSDIGYNEARHASAVARHLGTEHTELYLGAEAALALIPALPQVFDEPFADSSQLPMMLVARMARQHVTVALSGDGGDELFGGYNRYLWCRNLLRTTHRNARWPRRTLAAMLLGISASKWDKLLRPLLSLAPRSYREMLPGDRLHKLAALFNEDDPRQLYLRLITHWDNPESVVISGQEPPTALNRPSDIKNINSYIEHIMYLDEISYLPDDILVKVDRATMTSSLEARSPLLDFRVAEFAASLPIDYKLSRTRGKRALRELLYRYVPQPLVDRPKMGFGVPLGAWLRGPLRDWAESLLSESSLKSSGVFRATPIRRVWNNHLSGSQQRQYELWDILMYEQWLKHWGAGTRAAAA